MWNEFMAINCFAIFPPHREAWGMGCKSLDYNRIPLTGAVLWWLGILDKKRDQNISGQKKEWQTKIKNNLLRFGARTLSSQSAHAIFHCSSSILALSRPISRQYHHSHHHHLVCTALKDFRQFSASQTILRLGSQPLPPRRLQFLKLKKWSSRSALG